MVRIPGRAIRFWASTALGNLSFFGRTTETPSFDVYYSGCTAIDSEALDSQMITVAEGGTVGVTSPSDISDVSVIIPAGALAQDLEISIYVVRNPQAVPSATDLAYEFGPSGLEFSQPVTITIPYLLADYPDGPPEPYWYDPQTSLLSQEGISEVEVQTLSETLGTICFNTVHFTTYGLLEGAEIDASNGGGGGGCALSPAGQGRPVDFLLPYLAVGVIIAVLRWRDRRQRRCWQSDLGFQGQSP